jgi:hypothetical protein
MSIANRADAGLASPHRLGSEIARFLGPTARKSAAQAEGLGLAMSGRVQP